MDPELINDLAEFLNNQIGLETCDSSLNQSELWLRSHGIENTEEVLEWLEEQGVTCDCEVVTLLYLKLRQEGPNTVPQ